MEGEKAPLAGRTIVVTRSREQASELSRLLRDLGAAVIEIPTIALQPPVSWEPLDTALRSLDRYQWLIVTSANTARVLRERLDLVAPRKDFQPRTVAVGQATAAALRAAGLRVDLVPEAAVAESILAAIVDEVAGQNVLLVRAAVARDLLPEALSRAGATVTIVDAYRTVLAEGSASLVAETFRPRSATSREDSRPGAAERQPIDALTFTSSSTVANLSALLQRAHLDWPRGPKVFSIGPVTSATLRAHGVEPDSEALRHDVPGLVERVVQGLSKV